MSGRPPCGGVDRNMPAPTASTRPGVAPRAGAFRYAWVALPAAILLPVAVAVGLGYLIFRQRVRGAYFAILCQALAAAFAIWLVGEQGLTGGTNGLTNFHELLGFKLSDPTNQRTLYFVVAGTLLGLFLLARALIQSRYGRLLVAVRDGEDRVRFLGYNPLVVKTLAFAFSAALAGLAGALFVPVVGIISPTLVDVVPSLELLIGVAVGGRGTLYGAIIGAIAVNWAKTGLSEHFASGWLYFQGALFVLVIVYAPGGLVGLWRKGRDAVVGRRRDGSNRTGGTGRTGWTGRSDGTGRTSVAAQPATAPARTAELTGAP